MPLSINETTAWMHLTKQDSRNFYKPSDSSRKLEILSAHTGAEKQCINESLKRLQANPMGRPNYTKSKLLPPLSGI